MKTEDRSMKKMSISVRLFREEDAPGVAQVMFDSFHSYLGERMEPKQPRPPEYWINGAAILNADQELRTYVAVDETGKVLGVIKVNVQLKRGLGTLIQIGVDPAAEHQGIGSMLFEAADGFWRERHIRKAATCVSSINPKAYRFYQKHGFLREGILKDHFFPGVDEYMLARFYQQGTGGPSPR